MSRITPIQMALCISLTSLFNLESGRSPWRPRDPLLPEITAHWSGDSKSYTVRDSCLEYHAIFCKYYPEDFKEHRLPDGPISYRIDPTKAVEGSELSRLAQKVLTQIQAHKTVFDDFTVLKKSDFNGSLASGLIILKYKNYPFIIKLFLKTPQTFVTLSEGIVPRFLFKMGGGTNRHLSGFTRIGNLEKIQERINQSPYWSKIVEMPRKWYWTPKHNRWITIEGKNIGCNGPCRTELPAVYGIIADAIDAERQFSISKKDDCSFGLRFAHYIGDRMDAHVDNLLLEKKTGKIVVIDTEHFPTMVGLKEPMHYNDYKSWYLQLSGKCFQANFLRNKKMRRDMQRHPRPELDTLFPQHRVSLAQRHPANPTSYHI